MKIKEEYKGKTIITYDSVLGQRKIEVDKIDPKRFSYYNTIGLGYLFEKSTISYTGIDQEVKESDAVAEPQAVEPKPARKKPATKTRKRKTNASAN
jgi:hypothetical protein